MGYIIWFVLLIIVVLIVVLITIKHGGDEPLEHDTDFINGITRHINKTLEKNPELKQKLIAKLNEKLAPKRIIIIEYFYKDIRSILSSCYVDVYYIRPKQEGEYIKNKNSEKILSNLNDDVIRDVILNQAKYFNYLTGGSTHPDLKDSLICLRLGNKIPNFTKDKQDELILLIQTLVDTFKSL